jgi:hypothetical protein
MVVLGMGVHFLMSEVPLFGSTPVRQAAAFLTEKPQGGSTQHGGSVSPALPLPIYLWFISSRQGPPDDGIWSLQRTREDLQVFRRPFHLQLVDGAFKRIGNTSKRFQAF